MQKVSLLQLADVVTGKHDANHATTNGRYRFYTCAFEYSMCDTYRFDDECLIVPGNGANVGEVFYYNGRFDAYQRTYVVHNIKKEKVIPKYLFFHFQYNWRTLGTAEQYGAATNYIKIGNFINYKISLAPIELQKKIVGELDLLSSVIEKKKAQLEEYDQLAQSIFYDMFGDPITNEKGWEVKKLGVVCEYSKTRISPDELTRDNYVGVENLLQNCKGKEPANKIPNGIGLTRYIDGDVLIGNIRPYLKKIWLASNEGGCNGDVLAIRRKQEYSTVIIPIYVFGCLSKDAFFDFDMQYSKGEKMPRGDKKEILKYPICLPPLSLQQKFANKIEAIEKQKKLIKQSIAETETLFDSRMDFYFN